MPFVFLALSRCPRKEEAAVFHFSVSLIRKPRSHPEMLAAILSSFSLERVRLLRLLATLYQRSLPNKVLVAFGVFLSLLLLLMQFRFRFRCMLFAYCLVCPPLLVGW
ncbi:hypothetical protein PHSY_002927 [Pseudozyma hubeiensis SY62]|uniref:Uncharacterized protein n=1 Tax=Pseudozyma hubeiensis (strain SY62) TaxID=1305764 RepID=R9P2E1_PSEHS|nr:hypothetical protein PHSY_002927 [Pseudozyma hubeiensis SY62]GAC95352.1 hypothetical protein PHSY_002927 [Pseudozyma hubeiensis SY62]